MMAQSLKAIILLLVFILKLMFILVTMSPSHFALTQCTPHSRALLNFSPEGLCAQIKNFFLKYIYIFYFFIFLFTALHTTIYITFITILKVLHIFVYFSPAGLWNRMVLQNWFLTCKYIFGSNIKVITVIISLF